MQSSKYEMRTAEWHKAQSFALHVPVVSKMIFGGSVHISEQVPHSNLVVIFKRHTSCLKEFKVEDVISSFLVDDI